jgi:hypothetical protein
MSGEEFFGAAVRIIGFGILLYGIYTVMIGFLFAFWPHYWSNAEGQNREGKEGVVAGQFFFSGALQAIIGLVVIAEAQRITAWVY